LDNVKSIPKTENSLHSKTQTLDVQLAFELVGCLTSPKAETRHAAQKLLKTCVEVGAIRSQSVKSGVGRLLPAQQRSINPFVSECLGIDKANNSSEEVTGQSFAIRHQSGRRESTVRNTPNHRKTLQPTTKIRTQEETQESPKNTNILNATSASEIESHPLVSIAIQRGDDYKKLRLASYKRQNWPEFPEIPGPREIIMLKKRWQQILPKMSLEVLFPEQGILKQDDTIPGSSLLIEAVKFDERSSGSSVLVDDLDLVLQWLVIALCCRENTKGLHSLLSALSSLLTYLRKLPYVLSDLEASIVLPHLLEKSSVAKVRFDVDFVSLQSIIHLVLTFNICQTLSKGRFRESIGELIAILTDIYAPQNYGPQICIMVLERSSNSKARLLALTESCRCVEAVGLSGIGKRGIIHVCKVLSEDNLIEIRNAALDLTDMVISKMNGNIERFIKACGANLSDKAKQSIQERWTARQNIEEKIASPDADTMANVTITTSHRNRRSVLPSGNMTKNGFHTPQRDQLLTANKASKVKNPDQDIPQLKFAALSEEDKVQTPIQLQTHYTVDEYADEAGPFRFKYNSSRVQALPLHTCDSSNASEGSISSQLKRISEVNNESVHKHFYSPADKAETSNAGALQERLKRIRARTSLGTGQTSRSLQFSAVGKSHPSNEGLAEERSDGIELLLKTSAKVSDNDPLVQDAVICISSIRAKLGAVGSYEADQDLNNIVIKLSR